jgi:D-3-phosphoglycerate dehydrogenase
MTGATDNKRSLEAATQPQAKKMKEGSSSISFPKGQIKVLLLEGVSAKGIKMLKDDGFDVEALKTALTEEELLKKIENLHILGIRSKTQVSRKVIEASNRLLAIGCFCIGTDQVDLKAAQEKGVPVFNAPFANTRSVAELIIGNIVGLSRRIGECTSAMHRGAWFKQAIGCFEIRGKTLGVIGYGHIGAQVSVLAEAMGMKVIYYDVIPKLAMGNANQVGFDELLATADFVTLHVPNLASTKNMIGAEQFAQMKKGAYFLNASRGNTVVIPALAEALKTGHLRGAYVDVFPVEPGKNGENLFESELRGCPNTLMTPHVGGSTEEAQAKIGEEVASTLLKLINKGSTHGSVNFPEIDLACEQGKHRLLVTHKNQPGAMSEINKVLASAGANVCQQYLGTMESIGYVVIDLDQGASLEVKKQLQENNKVLKCRLLY